MNILTGVFVENAMKLAEPDVAEIVMEKRKADAQEVQELKRLCSSLDVDGSGLISEAEFAVQMRNPSSYLRTYLEGLGLDKMAVKRFFAMLSDGSGTQEVDVETFAQGCLKIRTPATALDMMSTAMTAQAMRCQMQAMEERLNFGKAAGAGGDWSPSLR